MSTLVYRYGAHAPRDGVETIREQLWLAHRYRNTLIEIERGRRAAVRQLEREYGLDAALREVEAARSACEAAYATVAKHRGRSRKRNEPDEARQALTEARAAEKGAVARMRELRASLRPSCAECTERELPSPCEHATTAAVAMLARADAIKALARGLAKNAYEHSGVYWGQRALVDDAAGDSFASLPLYDSRGEPNDPKFVRWTGDGSLGLQIIGGMSVDELHGCADSRLRIVPPDPRAWSGVCSDRRRYGSTAELSLRIGSNGREPVWGTWVVDMDRPLPIGARIVWATVHVRARGPHSEWSLSLTLDTSACAVRDVPATVGCAVAVDVGWRVVGDALRVAGWADERGRREAFSLQADTLRLFALARQYESERDDRFNGARLGMLWWAASDAALPAWLEEQIALMPRWHDPGRLFQLWKRWTAERFDGDEWAYALLTAWRWRNEGLWTAEVNTRLQAHRRRKDFYRVFAAKLADQYDTILIEAFDKRAIAKREALAEERANEVARTNRVIACTSDLCLAIVQAARSRGRACAAVACADTTRTCPSCGVVEDRDAAESIVLACAVCGARWDQDSEGAAVSMLARWRERPGDAKILASARIDGKPAEEQKKRGARWDKARRKGAENRARIEAARKASEKAAE